MECCTVLLKPQVFHISIVAFMPKIFAHLWLSLSDLQNFQKSLSQLRNPTTMPTTKLYLVYHLRIFLTTNTVMLFINISREYELYFIEILKNRYQLPVAPTTNQRTISTFHGLWVSWINSILYVCRC